MNKFVSSNCLHLEMPFSVSWPSTCAGYLLVVNHYGYSDLNFRWFQNRQNLQAHKFDDSEEGAELSAHSFEYRQIEVFSLPEGLLTQTISKQSKFLASDRQNALFRLR